ncbi:DUF2306 domain-containing protein [Streptacidiphilus jiangxiensis]|uniref:Predicted membrane protein n=1 Tax=Streptacidiphilus jiangxiensis TaxID=235985 RepID=A0A1H7XBM0_STRJI|nr:DUF2306 domain-containing protein [Streptacidiphilus jiangxiensis]SEM30577.1 Predicted membrane protein [Streptacidiphilus jiangxiensis]
MPNTLPAPADGALRHPVPAPRGPRRHRLRPTRGGWSVVTLLSLVMAAVAARYVTLDPAVFFSLQRATYLHHELPLGVHVSGAVVAMATGPWQFSSVLRRRWPRLHRRLGVGYLLGCLVAGIGALFLAPIAYGGAVSGFGFAALAVAWLTTGAIGLRMILRRRVADHRRWMLRSFALTFAAVTLRLMLALAGALHLDFRVSYETVAWLSWLPNLALAWWFTRKRPRTQS